jgi:hypothetical protein
MQARLTQPRHAFAVDGVREILDHTRGDHRPDIGDLLDRREIRHHQ